MSRCRACNEVLDRSEERCTYAASNEPLELCDDCLGPVRGDIDINGGDYFDDELDVYDDDETEY